MTLLACDGFYVGLLIGLVAGAGWIHLLEIRREYRKQYDEDLRRHMLDHDVEDRQ